MCGISGFVGRESEDTLARMNAIQAHRGPDDSGLYLSEPDGEGVRAGLGSRRLAILDLTTAGHMPMSNPEGTLWITYNGEIYNSPELRTELEGKGYRFRSRTDTEVLLYLYESEGPACIRRLNGMFALAVWDTRKRELFLARDHFGVKPLYYFHVPGLFAFASEVKALLEMPQAPRGLNLRALHQYLTLLWVPDPLTLFDGILKVPAGHFGLFKDGHFRLAEYWDLTFPPADHAFREDQATLAGELRERLMDSVQRQLLSDVPVGAFLSAGLDSSSIVAGMTRTTRDPVRTFTIGWEPSDSVGEITADDPSVVARTARRFGCVHTEITATEECIELLPKLVWHMDEPVADPAIIAAFLITREASKTGKVLLSGVGGDELFAGYRKHYAHYLAEHYRRLPAALRTRFIEPLILALPVMRGTRAKGWIRLAKKMARSGSMHPQERFLTDSTYLSASQKLELYAPDLRAGLNGYDPFVEHRRYLGRVADADMLNQMLYLDTKSFMASLNLTYTDKMSMASSIEVRVPFLDRELAEWAAWQVSPSFKLSGGVGKRLLREAMGPLLPREVLHQRKAGFGVPIDRWLARGLRPLIDVALGEERVRNRGLFSPLAVRRLVKEHRSGREDWSMQIWILLTLELWQQTFLDGRPAKPQGMGTRPQVVSTRSN